MAELRSLLAFMDPEDRARALRRYEQLFDRAGEAGEEELLLRLGSPIRQVLEVEQEYRRAKKEGVLIYADELAADLLDNEGDPAPSQAVPSDLGQELREAAAALEELTPPAAEAPAEDTEPKEEDLFPIADLVRDDASLPESGEAAPSADEIPQEAEAVPETEDVPQEAIAADQTEVPPEETPAEEEKPESLNFSDEDEGERTEENAPAPEKDDAAVARELERIMSAAPAPAPEEPPAEERQEEQPEDGSEEDEPDSDEPEEDEGPGAGRVFGAFLVTLPLILLWIVGLAVFLALGACSLAAGFALCAAGVYLAGYALGGYIAFMPDLLLVCGGALGCFALALLFLWLGLWFIVGGIAALVRVTARTYRRILRKKAGEDEDDE